MTLPTLDQLRNLSRDELIAVVLPLMERVSQLEAEIASLKQKPPSRDWKGNRPPSQRQRKKKRGAPSGHTKAERPGEKYALLPHS